MSVNNSSSAVGPAEVSVVPDKLSTGENVLRREFRAKFHFFENSILLFLFIFKSIIIM